MHDETGQFLDRPMSVLDTFAHPKALGPPSERQHYQRVITQKRGRTQYPICSDRHMILNACLTLMGTAWVFNHFLHFSLILSLFITHHESPSCIPHAPTVWYLNTNTPCSPCLLHTFVTGTIGKAVSSMQTSLRFFFLLLNAESLKLNHQIGRCIFKVTWKYYLFFLQTLEYMFLNNKIICWVIVFNDLYV